MPFVLSALEDVLAATGDHPLVRSFLRRRRRQVHGWNSRQAAVWIARDDRHSGQDGPAHVGAFGPADQAVGLIRDVAHLLPETARVSIPRGAVDPLATTMRMETRSDWDFRWTSRQPPPVPGEEDVVVLPADTDEEIAALLGRAYPTASTLPGDGRARRWVGVRDGSGRLVAIAADTSGVDVGHISTVATAPEHRGRGLGAAVTAYLTRRHLSEFGEATLGFYAANETARRLYDRLHYDNSISMTSGRARLVPPGDTPLPGADTTTGRTA